jgi:O-antigen/teichoic acid export membrane protein
MEQMSSPVQPGNPMRDNKTRRVLHNSFWYGLETGSALIGSFLATVLVARVLGPERIAYYNYLYWLATASGSLATLGMPTTVRKYMAEYFGQGRPEMARAIFVFSLRLQILVSGSIALAGLVACVWFVLPGYKLIASLLALSIFPRMISILPSCANDAAENMRGNVPGSIAGVAVSLLSVLLSLAMHWDLLGLAIGALLYPIVECALKLRSAWAPMRGLERVAIPAELRARMLGFSGRSLVLMVLNLVLWERSDLVLLRHLGKSLTDLTFFSLAFSITNQLLVLPKVFQFAAGNTMLAEYGRDRKSLERMVQTASRYTLLLGFPVLCGAAALSPALIRVVYGERYEPLIPLLTVMALFSIPKSLLPPAQTFLEANEHQGFLIGWFLFCGAWNIVVDWLLIPGMGAMGAAWGNGTAQLAATVGVWIYVVHKFGIRIHYAGLGRIVAPGILMGSSVAFVSRSLPSWPSLFAGFGLGVVVYLAGLRLFEGLTREDYHRLAPLSGRLPAWLATLYIRALGLVIAGQPAAVSAVD